MTNEETEKKLESVSNDIEALITLPLLFAGLELLSQDQILGLRDMLQGAINVMLKHRNDPERGDVGWREQDLECHLDHADTHVRQAWFACDADSDSGYNKLDYDALPHVDHATARIALYYAKKRLRLLAGDK